jgi:hypothetical protein
MGAEIKTTGDMRKQLAKAAMDVVEGRMSIEKAQTLHKLSRNITDSLYSEAKIGALQNDLGREVAKFGEMPIC